MGKAVKAIIGVTLTVVGFVTGNPALIVQGAAMTFSAITQKTPKASKATTNEATENRLSKRLDPEAHRKIVFGRTAGGLDMRYWEVYGANNMEYDEVLAVATHRVHSFQELYLNDELAVAAGQNSGVGKFYDGGLVRQMSLQGIPGTNTVQGGAGQNWNTTTSFTGCAHFRLRYVYSQEKWPQNIPSRYTQVVEGAPVYDPRRDVSRGGTHRINDQTTWDYAPLDSNGQPIGRNNALQVLWYLIGWRINGKLVAGRGVDFGDLDLDQFIVAANDCEAMEWYSDCILSTGDSHSANESILSAAAGGQLLDTGGRYSYHVAVDDTANVAAWLNDDHIVGGIEWTPKRKMSDQFNEVAGTFVDPSATSLYQPRAYPLVFDSAYYAQDGFKRRKTINFGAVQSDVQAQKLARIELNKGRVQGQFRATFNYSALQLKNWSLVRLTFSRYGWVDKLFRVVEQAISPMGGISMLLQEEQGDVYLGGTVQQLPPPSAGTGYNANQKVPSGSLTLAATSVSGSSGSVYDAVRATWRAEGASVDNRIKTTQLRYRKVGEDAWTFATGLTKDMRETSVSPLLALTEYEFQVRHISIHDVVGDWSAVAEATTENHTRVVVDEVHYPPTVEHPGGRSLRDVLDDMTEGLTGLEELIDQLGPIDPVDLEDVRNNILTLLQLSQEQIAINQRQAELTLEEALSRFGRDREDLGGARRRDEIISNELVQTRDTLTVAIDNGIAGVSNEVLVTATALQTLTQTTSVQLSQLNGAIGVVDSRVTTVVTDLSAETSTRQTQVSSLGGSIATVQSLATTTATALSAETTTRQGQVSSLGDSIASVQSSATTTANALGAFTTQTNTQLSQLGTNIALVDDRVTTTVTALSAETSTRNQQVSQLGTTIASVDGRVTTVATDLLAETNVRTQQVSSLGANLATVDTRSQTTASDVISLSQTTTTLNSNFGAFQSSATSQLSSLSSATGSLSSSLTSLSASVGANTSAITNVQLAAATESQTRAAADQTLTASFNGLNSTVSTQASAISGLQAQNNTARLDIVAAAGGGVPARFSIVSTYYGSSLALIASQIFFGENTFFDDASDTLQTLTGDGNRLVSNGPFGVGGQMLMWLGAANVPVSQMDRGNAYFYLARSSPRIGGSDFPGGSSSPLTITADYPVATGNSNLGGGYAYTGTVAYTVTGTGSEGAVIQFSKTADTGPNDVVVYQTGRQAYFGGSVSPGGTTRAIYNVIARSPSGASATMLQDVFLSDPQ